MKYTLWRLTTLDKKRANELLVYGIGVLRGENIVSSPKGRIHVALIILEELEDIGAWWQTKILTAWLRRAQRGDFHA